MDGMYEQNQMPHSNEAEQSVLGAIIIDPELIILLRKSCFLSRFIEAPSTYFSSNDAPK